MAANCSRVMGLSGEKVVSLVPLTMLLPSAQMTASAYQLPSATSAKGLGAVNGGAAVVAVEDGDDHRAGQRRVGRKLRVGHAVHQAVGVDVHDRVVEPVAGVNVLKGEVKRGVLGDDEHVAGGHGETVLVVAYVLVFHFPAVILADDGECSRGRRPGSGVTVMMTVSPLSAVSLLDSVSP